MSRANFPIVVHVLLYRNVPAAEIFLLRRANTGFLDGYFALPGGHLHAGELPASAAIRECCEETGATPQNLQPLCTMPYRHAGAVGINLIFAACQWDREPVIAEPQFADLALWASEAALPNPRAAWISPLLRFRDQGVWYSEFGADRG